MTRINVELLDKIERQITEHPETWDQRVWFDLTVAADSPVVDPPCGTTCCVAGWAVVLSGYHLVPYNPASYGGEQCQGPDGSARLISAVARELLGLDEIQADDLFHGGNDLNMLRQIFAELRAEAS